MTLSYSIPSHTSPRHNAPIARGDFYYSRVINIPTVALSGDKIPPKRSSRGTNATLRHHFKPKSSPFNPLVAGKCWCKVMILM